MVIAFDFDGTLTNKDTLFGFFLQSRTPCRILKIVLYVVSMILTKLKIFSNSKLKSIGILLFLKGKSKSEINNIAKNYAENIQLNDIYKQYYTPDAWIISASFAEYLQFIFPKQVIIASQLKYNHQGMVEGLAFNCYKSFKLAAIQKKKIDQIDCFYTDNLKTDKIIVDFAEKTFLIYNGIVKSEL
jgi:hydroxymethylpyrimidine pyrophosphatase-like HAD family hydrolase